MELLTKPMMEWTMLDSLTLTAGFGTLLLITYGVFYLWIKYGK